MADGNSGAKLSTAEKWILHLWNVLAILSCVGFFAFYYFFLHAELVAPQLKKTFAYRFLDEYAVSLIWIGVGICISAMLVDIFKKQSAWLFIVVISSIPFLSIWAMVLSGG